MGMQISAPVEFTCEPGYSTNVLDDPYEPAAMKFAIQCKAER